MCVLVYRCTDVCLHIVLVPLPEIPFDRKPKNGAMRPVARPSPWSGRRFVYNIHMLRYYPVKSNKSNFQYFAVQ